MHIQPSLHTTLSVCPHSLNGSGETAIDRERYGERGRGAVRRQEDSHHM